MRSYTKSMLWRFFFVCAVLSCVGCASKAQMVKLSPTMTQRQPRAVAASHMASDGLAAGQAPQEIAGVPKRAPQTGLPAPIKEADLVRIKGRWLYYLHSTKGLLQIDISDPRQPSIRASLPIYGTPVEMFVEGHRAHILVNDVLVLRQQRGLLRFTRYKTAQLMSVDLSDRRAPKILSAIDLPGRLREGVARKQGDTVYVVVKEAAPVRGQPGATLALLAYDVGTPRQIRLVQRADLLPRRRRSDYQIMGSRGIAQYAGRFVISATPEALMIATRWRLTHRLRRTAYLRGWRRRWRQRWVRTSQELISRVDVIALSGQVGADRQERFSRLGRFWLPGQISDQFKQSFYREGGRGIYLGLTVQNDWHRRGRRRWRVTANHFHTIALRPGESPERLAKLAFGKRHETIRGSAFDLKRRVVYAITALEKPPHEIIDPLYAISFKSPSQPKILSQINDLSGDMNLFRFIEGRRFLLAVGRDTSGLCKGFGRSQGRSRTAISVIDVRRLDRISLVQRKCFSFPRIRNVLSTTNTDRDQAHKMIGMASDGERHFVTVPLFFYRSQRTWRGRRRQLQSAVGLMQWDLRGYLYGRSKRRVLHNRGMMLHPEGRVKRTMLVKRKGQRWLLNLSPDHLSVGLLPDRGRPLLAASLALRGPGHFIGGTMGYRISQLSYGKGADKQVKLQLHHVKTGKVTTLWLRGLTRIASWRQGLLLIGWGSPQSADVDTHNIRQEPVLQARYLALQPGHKPLLHKPMSWEWSHQPPAFQSRCDVVKGRCVGGVRPGQRALQLPLGQGLVWLSWGERRAYGMKLRTRQLLWLRQEGKKLKLTTHHLSHDAGYHLVPVDGKRFFLTYRSQQRRAMGAMQLWSRHQASWRQSPWKPLPGALLSAGPRPKQQGLDLVVYQPSFRQLMLLRWSLTKNVAKLIDRRSFHQYSLASLIQAGDLLLMTSYKYRRSKLLLWSKRSGQLQPIMTGARLPEKAWLSRLRGHRLSLKLQKGSLQLDLRRPTKPRLVAYRP